MNCSKTKFNLLPILFSIFFSMGCESDENNKPTFKNGAFVVNEGGFGSANATITFYDPQSSEDPKTILKDASGAFWGDVLQSLTFDDDKAYLVLNGSNKIEIANAATLEWESTLSFDDLDKPRYVSIIDDKAYISVWGPYDDFYSLIDSYVLVVDLKTKTVEDKIDTDEGVEKLLYTSDKLFASNYNFGASNTLAVIDPTTNELLDQLELTAGPNGLVVDENDKLWVICTGTYAGNDGVLYRINPSTLEIEDSFEMGVNPDGDLAISSDKRTLIYNAGTSLYKMPITDVTAPTETWFDAEGVTSPYGLDVDPSTDDIYITDALNYATQGKVFVYSNEGVFKNSFNAGISPTGVVFH